MKKTFIMLLAAGALIASCQPKSKTGANSESVDSVAAVADTTVFEGTIPAADGPGIRYTVKLANDSTAGFAVAETYLEAENGKDQTTNYTGKAENVEKTVDGKQVKGLKLQLGEGNELYFTQPNDSILRMVSAELQESATGLSYDLKKK
uniref:Copper resistance protein NlpE N-terminal domain-containing protein n=2 Tax=unclassified Prevotella TaxID=2638335 RepID=A0AB33JGP3_9BACT